MNKVALTSLGAAGIGGTALGGAMLAKSSPSFATEKYKHAVLKLDGDEDIWKAKYLILKESKESPTNTTLASAWSKSKESGKEEEAKALLRKGCGEIYNSSEEVKYLKDFKKFCAKTNKDVSTKSNWITGDNKDMKWDSPLKSLKSYSGTLDSELDGIKKALPSNSNNFDDTHREWLWGWCGDTQQELFDGIEGTPKLVNQDTFCVE
ncbi:hypothetical protein HF1_05730 [Mycoplasma haemofelis str. Langford 1]|uniref:Uncharacterized protein n=1 Tax=Mycoplasma haemofelis (strain Langford 1) TaxID=941640 RepID=E8ZHG0_MYCHL|nr:hypothetical protein [Mycoplasma haemofelis]CBY92581.1 hypothetical protein HF1_05730 [Mycoplasma haemofelis str. Langford 1]